MKPEDAVKPLKQAADDLRAVRPDPQPLLEAAKEVTSLLRANAARAGHSVAIRVIGTGDGVRITVVGPQASRYRALARREMDARMPGVKAEIRAQITRRRTR